MSLIPIIKFRIKSMLFWKKSHSFSIHIPGFKNKHYSLPLNSMAAFASSVTIVEKPTLIPSFIFALIAWVLIYLNPGRSHPSYWQQRKSFHELLLALMVGTNPEQHATVQPNHRLEQIELRRQQEAAILEGLDTDREFRKTVKVKIMEQQMRLVDQTDDANPDADTDISSSMLPGPVKQILRPVQTFLTTIIYVLRVIKHIVTWEECYYTFWVSTFCIGLSIACLLIPWGFIMKWFPKCFAWLVFGPWMSLANRVKSQRSKGMRASKTINELEKMTSNATGHAMIKKENKSKEKEMKKKLFGKWITTIPTLKVDREIDTPLDDSYATPPDPRNIKIKEKIVGQNSVGSTIPNLDSDGRSSSVHGRAESSFRALNQTDEKNVTSETNHILVTAAVVWVGTSFFFSFFH